MITELHLKSNAIQFTPFVSGKEEFRGFAANSKSHVIGDI